MISGVEARATLVSRLTARRRQRGSRKEHTEGLTPDDHATNRSYIRIGRNRVVLVPDISLERAKIDVIICCNI